ncbi:MAG TPA: discoidin domain-containing protein, partial [Verrucomicrobiales bacterium]|nr:discoidin domain-containing protein [Verrucomicrobiales bacterium]
KTAWESPDPIDDKMWISIELPGEKQISGVTITSNASTGQTRNLTIETSSDGVKWSKPVFKGAASCAVSDLTFAPVTARFLRIASATKGDNRNKAPWIVNEIVLYGFVGQ